MKTILKLRYGATAQFEGYTIKVKPASKQKYLISKKLSLDEDEALVTELIIQNAGLDVTRVIVLDASKPLQYIADQINIVPNISAKLSSDRKSIVVESSEAGLKNSFYLSSTPSSFLSIVVPEEKIQIMDVFSASGKPFTYKDKFKEDGNEDCSFQPGSIHINDGRADFSAPKDVLSLETVCDAFNRHTEYTEAQASIEQASSGYFLHIKTTNGRFLNYKGGNVFQGSDHDVQLKFSAAQDIGIEVDGPCPFTITAEEISDDFVQLTIIGED